MYARNDNCCEKHLRGLGQALISGLAPFGEKEQNWWLPIASRDKKVIKKSWRLDGDVFVPGKSKAMWFLDWEKRADLTCFAWLFI